MAKASSEVGATGAHSSTAGGSESARGFTGGASAETRALVEQLDGGFREQVRRAIACELDGSPISLAFVDHYLGLDVVRQETREPILMLLAAGAGAYFGEVVRQQIGGTWIGDGRDPRRLRFLLGPQLIHFAPVDLALETITRGDPDDSSAARAGAEDADPPGVDAAFRLDKTAHPSATGGTGPEPIDDATWVEQHLSELPPVPIDQYYSLTSRYETLTLILELLALKHASEGREPATYALQDYVDALVGIS